MSPAEKPHCVQPPLVSPAPRVHGHGVRAPTTSTISSRFWAVGLIAALFLLDFALPGNLAHGFLRLPSRSEFFAIDPDVVIRKMDPTAPDHAWTMAQGWGLPPLFYRTKVPNLYDRWDFLYPLGCREESYFRSRTKFTPLVDTQWYKIPPYDGHSRYLTAFWGQSDLGQKYWGVFPFYGYSYRRFGADSSFFCMFPLYSESTYDSARTIRILWPLITYAKSPGRNALKVWPLYGNDAIGKEYFNWYVLWPLFQKIDKYPGTDQAYSYTASPFPLYTRQETCYSTTVDLLWPLITYYHHRPSGHTRYSVRPFFTYGTGGGIEELNIFYVYQSKKDRRKGTSEGTLQDSSGGFIAVGDDEVFTERKFLMMSSIQKRYRKGCLVFAKYKFWPFAEYWWDAAKGSHLGIPEVTGLKNDWWDINLGRLLRLVDIRDTPITHELSLLFGLSQRTEIKSVPYIPPPPKAGDDGWSELIAGSFGKR